MNLGNKLQCKAVDQPNIIKNYILVSCLMNDRTSSSVVIRYDQF